MDKSRLYFWRNINLKVQFLNYQLYVHGQFTCFPEPECKIFIITLGEKDTPRLTTLWSHSTLTHT